MVRILSAAFVALFVLSFLSAPANAQNATQIAAGQSAFRTQCAVCHMASANGHALVGPNLYNVVGRRAASVEHFPYSQAMRQSNITWSTERITAFIQHPAQIVPGTRMTFAGVRNADQAASIAAYLASLPDTSAH